MSFFSFSVLFSFGKEEEEEEEELVMVENVSACSVGTVPVVWGVELLASLFFFSRWRLRP